MCLRSPARLIALAALAVAGGCDREERHSRGKPLGETIPASARLASLTEDSPTDARAAAYEGNAYAIAQGLRLYTWMNCVGCHHHGGGGMGPPLMDGEWRYGGRIDQIAASIYEGRPRGMPAWKDRLTEQQIWQLAAYVRTLSGQERKDAVTARADSISNTPPQTQTVEQPVVPARPAQ
jgi:cytochrome c oxidase cbb3-type subunit 3